MVKNEGGGGEGEGGGGPVTGGIPTTTSQTRIGLYIAIGLGVLVILGAVLRFTVWK